MPYTLTEASYLIEYYSDKMIGKYLDKDKTYIIKQLKKDQIESDLSHYMVRACGQRDGRGLLLFLEISEIAKDLSLDSPQTVLLRLNQGK